MYTFYKHVYVHACLYAQVYAPNWYVVTGRNDMHVSGNTKIIYLKIVHLYISNVTSTPNKNVLIYEY